MTGIDNSNSNSNHHEHPDPQADWPPSHRLRLANPTGIGGWRHPASRETTWVGFGEWPQTSGFFSYSHIAGCRHTFCPSARTGLRTKRLPFRRHSSCINSFGRGTTAGTTPTSSKTNWPTLSGSTRRNGPHPPSSCPSPLPLSLLLPPNLRGANP